MPTNQVPITIVLVHNQLATTATANFPNQAAYAHIVSRVVHCSQRCYSLVWKTSALIKLVESEVHVGICKSAELSLSLSIVQADKCSPVERCASVVLHCVLTVVDRQRSVVKLSYTITSRRSHRHCACTLPCHVLIEDNRIDSLRQTSVTDSEKICN